MLPLEHSAILSTFIKLPLIVKTFVLSFLSGRFTQVSLTVQAKGENTDTYGNDEKS